MVGGQAFVDACIIIQMLPLRGCGISALRSFCVGIAFVSVFSAVVPRYGNHLTRARQKYLGGLALAYHAENSVGLRVRLQHTRM